jgi:hypothetical protein
MEVLAKVLVYPGPLLRGLIGLVNLFCLKSKSNCAQCVILDSKCLSLAFLSATPPIKLKLEPHIHGVLLIKGGRPWFSAIGFFKVLI